MLQDDWSPSIIYKYPKQHNVTLPATEHLAGFAAFLAGPQADCSNTAPCDKSKKESTSKSYECCHLPFAWMPFPLLFSEKLVFLNLERLSTTQAGKHASLVDTGFKKCDFPGHRNADFWRSMSRKQKTKQGSRSNNRSIADASIQKPDSCARRKPTRPELRIC